MFSFSKFQEAIRRETTKGSSSEFMYLIPQYEQNAQSYSPGFKSTKVCQDSDWLSRHPHLKLE